MGVSLDKIEDLLVVEFKIPRKVSDVLERLLDEEHYTFNQDPRDLLKRFKVRT